MYARRKVVEAGPGYKVTISAPVIDSLSTVVDEGDGAYAPFEWLASAVIEEDDLNRDYLVTIDVNGESVAFRELCKFENGEATIGCITVYIRHSGMFRALPAVSSSEDQFLEFEGIPTASPADADDPAFAEDDEIYLRLEPVKIALSDAFRAAVKKAYVPPVDELLVDRIDLGDGDGNESGGIV